LINVSGGKIKRLSFQPATNQVKILLAQASPLSSKAFMTLEQPGLKAKAAKFMIKTKGAQRGSGYEISLSKSSETTVIIDQQKN